MTNRVSIQAQRIQRRGFTIIELLIVIVIMIILAGITTAVGLNAKTNAGIRSTKTTLKTLTGIMNDYLAAGNPEPTDTADPADQVNWIKAVRTLPDLAGKISGMKLGNIGSDTTVVDSFGTAIRYVPTTRDSSGNVIKQGYFSSAGPDTQFTSSSQPSKDDIFSTDPQ